MSYGRKFRSRLLPHVEPEVSKALAQVFRDEGITMHCGVTYDACQRDGDRAVLCIEGKRLELTADHLVVTAGRSPNTEGLGLAEMGIETDSRGAIMVGDYMHTSRPGVYAAADVASRDQFVYMAAYGAKLAARNAMDGAERYDNSAMPWVVFTDPQVAGVGLSEAQAIAEGHEVKTSVLMLDNVPRAVVARDTRGLIKLVANAKTDRLLGGVISAPEGSDSVQTLALALKARLPWELRIRGNSVLIHPAGKCLHHIGAANFFPAIAPLLNSRAKKHRRESSKTHSRRHR